jgi:hypothetical protein
VICKLHLLSFCQPAAQAQAQAQGQTTLSLKRKKTQPNTITQAGQQPKENFRFL